MPRYKTRLPGILRPDGFLNTDIYYVDTFVTDFRLLHKSPRLQAILNMLADGRAPADHPLLTEYEFTEWRRVILEAYAGECPKQGEPRFIDEAYVNAFTQDALPMIDDVFAQAFPGA